MTYYVIQRWSYKVISFGRVDEKDSLGVGNEKVGAEKVLERELNRLGDEGWELVTPWAVEVIPYGPGGLRSSPAQKSVLVFKKLAGFTKVLESEPKTGKEKVKQ